jgi:hypothetical protein
LERDAQRSARGRNPPSLLHASLRLQKSGGVPAARVPFRTSVWACFRLPEGFIGSFSENFSPAEKFFFRGPGREEKRNRAALCSGFPLPHNFRHEDIVAM